MQIEGKADWDAPHMIPTLKRLWDQGLSTAQIGREMGVSKNAVVGKAHRVGLQRESPIKPKSETSRRANRKPPAAPKITLPIAPAKPEPIKYAYRGTCCFPFGEPGKPSFRFCDKPALAGRPYCLPCCKLAYVDFGRADKRD